jgi:hypothetical protein
MFHVKHFSRGDCHRCKNFDIVLNFINEKDFYAGVVDYFTFGFISILCES